MSAKIIAELRREDWAGDDPGFRAKVADEMERLERCAEILREIVFGGGYRLEQYQRGREALEAIGITGPAKERA